MDQFSDHPVFPVLPMTLGAISSLSCSLDSTVRPKQAQSHPSWLIKSLDYFNRYWRVYFSFTLKRGETQQLCADPWGYLQAELCWDSTREELQEDFLGSAVFCPEVWAQNGAILELQDSLINIIICKNVYPSLKGTGALLSSSEQWFEPSS